MGDQPVDLPGLAGHGLSGILTVADPNCELYRSVGLEKGSLVDLINPRMLKEGFRASKAGYKVSGIKGDGWQLPGMFLVENGEIIAAHRGKNSADHGNFIELVRDH